MMKPPVLSMLLLLAGSWPVCEASELQIDVAPRCDVYHPGEPIDLRFSIHNTGQDNIQILFQYPRSVGVFFSCPDEAARSSSELELGGRLPTLSLRPGERYVRTLALNRYLSFASPKQYYVDFVVELMEPVSAENRQPRTFSRSGRIVVNIETGPADPQRIASYLQQLEEGEPETVEQAIEVLLWADDPSIIVPLADAVERSPGFASDVVDALGRLFGEAQAQDKILMLAREHGPKALQAALGIFGEHRVEVPHGFIERILTSQYSGKTYPTLKYLLEHGGAKHAALVKPFTEDESPAIRELAQKVLQRLSSPD